jgi:outer membrane phospholipase A
VNCTGGKQENLRFGWFGRAWCWLGIIVFFASVFLSDAAEEQSSAFLAPAEPLTAGSQASLWLYQVQDTSPWKPPSFAPTIAGQFLCGSNAADTSLTLVSNQATLVNTNHPGDLLKTEYQFQIPSNLSGIVTLEISNFNPVTLVIRPEVSVATLSPLTTAATVPFVVTNQTGKAVRTNSSVPMVDYVRRNLENHISFYEPIYFLLGNPIAEFQLSLKYQVFSFQNLANPYANVADHVYFAYTQTSYWDLLTSDPYFYDNSYKPSVFIYYTNLVHGARWQLDWQGGTEHESNGRGGSNERSLYTAYLQPTLSLDLPENFTLSLQPRARLYYSVGDNNPDIAEYRGYADLLGALTWQKPGSEERIQFSTKFRIGSEGAHPGLLFDLRFNVAGVPLLESFNPTIQLQYFTGFGQTLIQYNQKSTAFRAGLCLWY